MSMKSMTGYGRGEHTQDSLTLFCEVKSLNHRFFEMRLRAPSRFSFLENQVRQLLKKEISRGVFDISVKFSLEKKSKSEYPQIDMGLAKHYGDFAKKLAKEIDGEDEISTVELLKIPGVIKSDEENIRSEADWVVFEKALMQAVKNLIEMRTREGNHLSEILRTHTQQLKSLVKDIVQEREPALKGILEKQEARIKKLIPEGVSVDPDRILQEAAFISDRIDITEEINRLEAHLVEVERILDGKSKDPVGRKLDFIVQELHRETNTIGSKTQGLKIIKKIVEAKSEIEKMREQVQNVE